MNHEGHWSNDVYRIYQSKKFQPRSAAERIKPYRAWSCYIIVFCISDHFHGACLLFYHYIINVKVIDYSITEVTLNTVKDNLERMCLELFHPLILKQQGKGKVMIIYLNMSVKMGL